MKQAVKYLIQQYSLEAYDHGGAGYVDVERLLINDGFERILFPYQQDLSFKSKIGRFIFLLKTCFRISKGDTVVFIYPVYARIVMMLIRWISSRRNVKLVCFVMDIDGIKAGDHLLLESEIQFFRKFSHFIVLNDAMGEWIKSVHAEAIYSSLHFVGFLAPVINIPRLKSFDLVFSGNLAKSPFLEQLQLLNKSSRALHFNLYGPGATTAMIEQVNVSYFGISRPYEMPGKVSGAFGLIWEGDSIDVTGSAIGNYTRYISNHKLSLYILSGLPIILWEDAAMAVLVRHYGIGVTIKNLYEIEDRIKTISDAEYALMQQNMKPLAEKISQGLFQKEAMNDLLQKMQ